MTMTRIAKTTDVENPWRNARCREDWVDPEIFDPESRSPWQIELAKTVCRGCPIEQPCLAWALKHEDYLVWGGTTPAERRDLRQALRKA